MQKDILSINTAEITDTKGALGILTQRLGRDYSKYTLQYHVRQGNIPAYVFDEGDLVRWHAYNERQGASYIFLKRDVEALPLESKAGRKPKTAPTT